MAFPPAMVLVPLPASQVHEVVPKGYTSELPEVAAYPIGSAPTYELAADAPAAPACVATAPKDLASKPGFTEFALAAWENSSGKAIENLKQSDFSATSAGKTLPIAMFSDATPANSIAIVVDTSGSMTSKIPWVRAGIAQFVRELPAQDDVALFAYSDHTFLLQEFTRDHSLLQEKLAQLHAYGQTATFDTIVQVAGYLSAKGTNPKRAMLLVTDGMDNASAASAAKAGADLRKDGIAFFGIGIGDPSPSAGASFAIGPFALPSIGDADRVDAETLRSLASTSGGKFWIVNPAIKDSADSDFMTAVNDAAKSLGTAYSVGVILPTPIRHHEAVHFAIKDHPDASIVACEAMPPAPPTVATAAQ